MTVLDTFFPDIKSRRGSTCSQFFVRITLDRWEVYPMKMKSHNGSALQEYSRNVGVPSVLKTDNAQNKLGTN
eukprot:10632642-Ditylum_brightwellii.AAC.1